MSLQPKKLAIYYGWPISVNGTNTVPLAAAVFDAYDDVVFGAGLEDPAHPSYQNTKDIVAATTAKIWGYVDAANPAGLGTILNGIDQWKAVGANVAGIFFDQFGFDFGLDRMTQNQIVQYCHCAGLNAFVNAWDPDDVWAGTPASKVGATDKYLAESWAIKLGVKQDETEWKTKRDKMAGYKASEGTEMYCVTTTTAVEGFDQNEWDFALALCSQNGFDSCGWGEPSFSGPDSLLPFRTRYSFTGTAYTGSLSEPSASVYSRQTNVGVVVDYAAMTVGIILP